MKVLTWQEFQNNHSQEKLAATVGVFDGLHYGHQVLIDTIKLQSPALKPCIITFKENPKKILNPSSYKGSLLTLEQKLSGFQHMGIEYCVMIDFSDNFAKLSGREFLAALYIANVQFIAVGVNFQFGHNLDTNAAKVEKLSEEIGLRSCIVENVMYRGHAISSSRIRHVVLEGRLGEAAEMIGRPYQVLARRETSVIDEKAEFFLPEDDLLIPPEGQYEVFIKDNDTVQKTKVNVVHNYIALNLRMRSDNIRLAFVDKAVQQKENVVWL